MRIASIIAPFRQYCNIFVSACSMRIASCTAACRAYTLCPLSQRAPCGLHHLQNHTGFVKVIFVSACSMRIASLSYRQSSTAWRLCLSVLHADCIAGQRASGAAGAKLCLSVLHADCIHAWCILRAWSGNLCLSVLHADCIQANARLARQGQNFVSACSMRIASRFPS